MVLSCSRISCCCSSFTFLIVRIRFQGLILICPGLRAHHLSTRYSVRVLCFSGLEPKLNGIVLSLILKISVLLYYPKRFESMLFEGNKYLLSFFNGKCKSEQIAKSKSMSNNGLTMTKVFLFCSL